MDGRAGVLTQQIRVKVIIANEQRPVQRDKPPPAPVVVYASATQSGARGTDYAWSSIEHSLRQQRVDRLEQRALEDTGIQSTALLIAHAYAATIAEARHLLGRLDLTGWPQMLRHGLSFLDCTAVGLSSERILGGLFNLSHSVLLQNSVTCLRVCAPVLDTGPVTFSEHLRFLTKFQRLRSLELRDFLDVDWETVAEIVCSLPDLRNLYLVNCGVVRFPTERPMTRVVSLGVSASCFDNQLESLRVFPALRFLYLGKIEWVTDEMLVNAMTAQNPLSSLVALSLTDCSNITDGFFPLLLQLQRRRSSLEELTLRSLEAVTGFYYCISEDQLLPSLCFLECLSALKRLNMSQMNALLPSALTAIGTFVNRMDSIHLHGQHLTGEGFFKAVTYLDNLRLSRSRQIMTKSTLERATMSMPVERLSADDMP